MMLTAFLDDSDMGGQGPVAVLGGFVAPTETWAEFSNDWKAEVLDVPSPPVRVFKPNANSSKLTTPSQRMNAALSVLERHNLLGVVINIPHDVYESVRQRRAGDKRFSNPYLAGLLLITTYVQRYFSIVHPSAVEKVSFVFDIQPGSMDTVRDSWVNMYDSLSDDKRKLISRTPPIFADDAEVLPLQAAHMVAWNSRRVASDAALGKHPFQFNWPEKLKVIDVYVTEELLMFV